MPVERVNKVAQGRPHIVDKIVDGEVQLVFNTTEGWQSLKDSQAIREAALKNKVPYFTTAPASLATARAIEALRGHALEVKSLQSYYSASNELDFHTFCPRSRRQYGPAPGRVLARQRVK